MNLNFNKIIAPMPDDFEKMKGMLELLQDENISNEGLMTVLRGITDATARVINNFKTMTTKFTKDLKRSEIRAYTESHPAAIKFLDKLNYNQVMNIMVPKPTGMIVTYRRALDDVLQAYVQLNATALTEQARGVLFKYVKDTVSQAPVDLDTMRELQGFLVKQAKVIDTTMTKVRRNYSMDKKVATITEVCFGDLYESMSQFKDVRMAMLGGENFLMDVSKMCESMDGMQELLLQAIDTLSAEDISANYSNKQIAGYLGSIAEFMAHVYDSYGVLAQAQAVLEHNHIAVMDKLYSELG